MTFPLLKRKLAVSVLQRSVQEFPGYTKTNLQLQNKMLHVI